MIPTAFSFVYLISTSALLSVILAAGYQMFGRPRHAATWSAVFAVATLLWILRLVAATEHRGLVMLDFCSAILSNISAALLLVGFRQRAGAPLRRIELVIVCAVTIAGGGLVAWLAPTTLLRWAPQLVPWAIFMTLAAATMIERGRVPDPAEKTAIAVLLGFALFEIAMVIWGAGSTLLDRAPDFELYRNVLLLVSPAGFLAVGVSAVFLLAADLAARMRLLATVDPLTGILNRRGLEQAAAQSIAHCRRQRLPLSVVLADLDQFKQLNDRFGHAAGDVALQRFARHVSGSVRVGDSVGRIGGEEFAFLLVDTFPGTALEVVERIRAGVCALDLDGAGRDLTASFGVAALRASDQTLDDVLARADAALYASKMGGRDRVTLADDQADAGAGTA